MATSTVTTTPVCLTCQEAVYEEVDGGDPDTDTDLSALARELGADIADHCCDAVGECGCACNQHSRP